MKCPDRAIWPGCACVAGGEFISVLALLLTIFCVTAVSPADPELLPSIAVLDEPGMPQRGAPASPETVAGILSDGGLRVERLSATQFSDPSILNVTRFDLVVLPTGETFPDPNSDPNSGTLNSPFSDSSRSTSRSRSRKSQIT